MTKDMDKEGPDDVSLESGVQQHVILHKLIVLIRLG